MAAGRAGVSGPKSGSSPRLESTLDRRFQTVSNTMESIQGLSAWCIENKKYHSVVVKYWLKWMRKSDASHRLNLFYLANDVIQNCKRKNAMVYRTTFTDVLPEAMNLIRASKDSKVKKSVERILSIWEERSVYSEELTTQLKSGLIQIEEPVKGDNCWLIFTKSPSAFIEHLSKYRKSMDDIELREKQLAAMRVDVCSTEALKKLKDKAGGKRFSKDFEDSSTKLQEFVSFLDGEVKKGPSLVEALENADIFYEMQYKEVKIVAKAYETFANRVSHLKRKLDAMKAMIPDPDDSPLPSPVEDAPSPTGSESPFEALDKLGTPDPELDGQAMEEDLIALADAPSPLSSPGGSPPPSVYLGEKDNCDIEDMELSDVEETETPAIIEEFVAPAPTPISKQSSTTENITESLPVDDATLIKPAPAVTATVPSTVMATTAAATTTPTTHALPVNFAGVDLGKISSILNTLMKNSATGVTPASRPSPNVTSTPSTALKTPTTTAPPANPLTSILSRVDISTNTLLSALSKTQSLGGFQGLSSLLNSPSAKTNGNTVSVPNPVTPETPPKTESNEVPTLRDPSSQHVAPTPLQSNLVEENANAPSTLDSKIDTFLQGNPRIKGFNLGFPSVLSWSKTTADSPSASTENLGGTPVRDEAGATPTQDEIMDHPQTDPFPYQQGQTVSESKHPSWQDASEAQTNQQMLAPIKGSVPSLSEADDQCIKAIRSSYMANHQQPSSVMRHDLRPNPAVQDVGQNPKQAEASYSYPTVPDKVRVGGSDPYVAESYFPTEQRQDATASSFFNISLPPIPQLPPPPQDFMGQGSSSTSGPPAPRDRLGSFGEADRGVVEGSYAPTGPNYEPFPVEVPKQEPFYPHQDGASHSAHPPHHVPNIPPNAHVDFNHHHHHNQQQHPPRVPLQHPPHHHIESPSPVRSYHDQQSPPRLLHEENYPDMYYDYPQRSPSPPHYDMHPISPRTQDFYPEEIPPPYLERRGPPHLEPRHPPPHLLQPPHPGHYPPARPFRRPPPGNHEGPFLRGKRPGPPFSGPPRVRGPFYPPKRPFLPPHY
ncbi:hypothetical protein DNTS_009675 [Danionella cerebrum]|uniref:Regulation of nuclear pre-mRNA domain-containing protein 2 n=1 Tax=Danionella cerebrum TaxID=2873325 RepID=A0A553NI54_9TELE|nr:hypothetical protein DNTS_009675 [Danionella translucida]